MFEDDRDIYNILPIEPQTTYSLTVNMTGNNKAILGRFLGCVMIGLMPSDGLEEALVSLHDMLKFYYWKPSPSPARQTKALVGANIADHRKRPDLLITE